MFSTDIRLIQTNLKKNPSVNSQYSSADQSSSDFDLQYQLYTKYLHIAKQQISVNELMAISDSHRLIQTIAGNRKIDLSRDISSTMDSFSYDDDLQSPSMIQDISIIQRNSSKKITRKGVRHSTLRSSNNNSDALQEILEQIQRNCTQKTFTTIQSLIRQHKKNLAKMTDIQKKQKTIRKNRQHLEKAEQNNLLLNLKVCEFEEKIKQKDTQISLIKEKLSHFDKNCIESVNDDKVDGQSVRKTSDSEHNLVSFLNKKEYQLTQRTIKIQRIEKQIEQKIQASVLNANQQKQNSREQNNSCTKCCAMIKKIKESVMNYRTYLEQQAQQCQKVYSHFKKQLQNEQTRSTGIN